MTPPLSPHTYSNVSCTSRAIPKAIFFPAASLVCGAEQLHTGVRSRATARRAMHKAGLHGSSCVVSQSSCHIANAYFTSVPKDIKSQVFAMRENLEEVLGFSLNLQTTHSTLHSIRCVLETKFGFLICTSICFPIIMRSWTPGLRILVLPVETVVSPAWRTHRSLRLKNHPEHYVHCFPFVSSPLQAH